MSEVERIAEALHGLHEDGAVIGPDTSGWSYGPGTGDSVDCEEVARMLYDVGVRFPEPDKASDARKGRAHI